MIKLLKHSRIGLFIHNNLFRPRWKYDFISRIRSGETLLDVGCGNNSPYRYKTMYPHIHYTGLDVGNYNQAKPILADEYVVTTPERFASEIESRSNKYDHILSSHNIEHCLNRSKTLIAMSNALRKGGRLYIAFPSSDSINLPARKGTLNYYDDPTHLETPPDFEYVLAQLRENNLVIEYANPRYRPFIMRMVGLINEPISKWRKKVGTGTWELYGFESIIWARRAEQ